ARSVADCQPGGIAQHGLDGQRCGIIFGVRDGYVDRHCPSAVSVPPRIAMDAVGDDVYPRSLDQPDMAIDSRAFIPPALGGTGIDADSQRVEIVTEESEGRKVDGEAGKAVEM